MVLLSVALALACSDPPCVVGLCAQPIVRPGRGNRAVADRNGDLIKAIDHIARTEEAGSFSAERRVLRDVANVVYRQPELLREIIARPNTEARKHDIEAQRRRAVFQKYLHRIRHGDIVDDRRGDRRYTCTFEIRALRCREFDIAAGKNVMSVE
jgi:hypothetical protein